MMHYIKLIALKIEDFESKIFCETNYNKNDFFKAYDKKKKLENEGYFCILIIKPLDVIINK